MVASVGSNSDNTVITAKFISSIGYLDRSTFLTPVNFSIGYLVIKFPACASVPSFNNTLCSSANILTPISGFSANAICNATTNNYVHIFTPYADYSKSNGSLISFSVTLAQPHTCIDSSYILVVGTEPFRRWINERCVVFNL